MSRSPFTSIQVQGGLLPPDLIAQCRRLTVNIDELEANITTLIEHLAPSLLAIKGHS